MTRRTGLLLALALALVVFVVDQAIKSVVEGSMRIGESINLVPGFLSLTYTKNDGGAFGILGGNQLVLLVGSTIAFVVVFWMESRPSGWRRPLRPSAPPASRAGPRSLPPRYPRLRRVRRSFRRSLRRSRRISRTQLYAGMAHTAAGVGGRRGLVEAPDRGPVICVTGGRPHVEKLLGRELAVEDVAPDEPDVLLHVVRSKHLAVQDRPFQVRRQPAVAVDHTVGVSLQFFSVGLLGPSVRDPLRKERHYVVPLGAKRPVEHRGYNTVGERPARRLSAACILEGLLDVVDGVGQLYGPARVLSWTRVRGEVR